MANEFKVKNGIKFPDNTIQTTAATGGGGASVLDDLTDVVITGTPSNGQVLKYDSGTSKWVNGTDATGGGGGSSTLTISNKTGAYTVVAGDLGSIINCTSGTFTVSLDAAATLGAGFNITIWNTGTGVITIDPNASETIDGLATRALYKGEGAQLVCTGSAWLFGNSRRYRGFAQNVGSGETATTAAGDGATAWGFSVSAAGANSTAGGYLATAGSNFSTAIGNNSVGNGSQTITGSGAMALGGSYASGADSFAAAIANNSSTYGSTGANSVSLGYQSKSTGTASTSIGYTTVSSGSYTTAIGYGATASGTNTIAVGGWWNYGAPTASTTSSIAIGDGVTADAIGAVAFGNAAITNGIRGKYSYSNGRFAANGDSQTGTFVLRRTTTNGTATALTTDDTAAAGDDQIILPNNSAYAFSGILVGRQQASAGTASAAWEIKGLITREGSAGTTTLVNSAITVINNAPGWTLALSADTTNGGLAITVTGSAATNIRWVATIQTSEVTYA